MVPRLPSMPPSTAPITSPLTSSARNAVVVFCTSTPRRHLASCQSQNDTSSNWRKKRSRRGASRGVARHSITDDAGLTKALNCSANNVESGPGPREGNRQNLPIGHVVGMNVARRGHVMAHVAVEEKSGVENFLVGGRRQRLFM